MTINKYVHTLGNVKIMKEWTKFGKHSRKKRTLRAFAYTRAKNTYTMYMDFCLKCNNFAVISASLDNFVKNIGFRITLAFY